MNKMKLLKIVNPLIAVQFVLQVFSVIALIFLSAVIPAEKAGKMHTVGGFVLIGLIIVHIFLNWNWIKTNFFKKMPAKQN